MIYTHFKCPSCNRVSTAGEWDMATRQHIKTDRQKKTYKSIKLAGAGARWYQCPKCDKQSDNKFITKHLKHVEVAR